MSLSLIHFISITTTLHKKSFSISILQEFKKGLILKPAFFSKIRYNSSSTIRLRTEDTARLKDQLLRTEPLVFVIVCVANESEVPGLCDQTVLTSYWTWKGVPDIWIQ